MYRKTRSPILESLYNARPMRAWYCQCFQLKYMLPMEDFYAAIVLCTPGIPGSVFIIP